jgi:hypothetical protein
VWVNNYAPGNGMQRVPLKNKQRNLSTLKHLALIECTKEFQTQEGRTEQKETRKEGQKKRNEISGEKKEGKMK